MDVSPDLISRATEAVVEELRAWQERTLEPAYLVVYLDALVVVDSILPFYERRMRDVLGPLSRITVAQASPGKDSGSEDGDAEDDDASASNARPKTRRLKARRRSRRLPSGFHTRHGTTGGRLKIYALNKSKLTFSLRCLCTFGGRGKGFLPPGLFGLPAVRSHSKNEA